jgi:hypothetical protein
MKMSGPGCVEVATRFVARETKVTNWPLAETGEPGGNPIGFVAPLFACSPVDDTSQRVVVWVWRSRMKTSGTPFVSPGTRFVAFDPNSR